MTPGPRSLAARAAGLLLLGGVVAVGAGAVVPALRDEGAASVPVDGPARAVDAADAARALADPRPSPAPEPTAVPAPAAPDGTAGTAESAVPPAPEVPRADRAAGLLATDVPEAASGVLDVVPGSQPAPGAAGVRTVRVEVERGLPVDGAAFAATVMTTLNDPRGWGAHGDVTFARTDGPADLRVVLGSPALVDALCAPLPTAGQVSCGRNGHAALNFRRWVQATEEFADRTQYRQYLVNHEVGHLLGHPHEGCPGAGQPAPIMQQQTLAVAPCLPNGWPFPQG